MTGRDKMLTIPLKTTKRFDLTPPLTTYIKNAKHFPHPSHCRDGLMRIAALRNCLSSSLCTRYAHVNAMSEDALRDAIEYHAALVELESLDFPLEDYKMEGFKVDWECAFKKGDETTTRYNIAYERACILYDIASMESYLASQSNFQTKEGIKSAIHRYNATAGIFLHIRKNLLLLDPKPSLDLTPVCLEMCETLMLAQAQSCIYDMAGSNPTPNHSILAKLAIGVSDLYVEAIKLCDDPSLSKMTDYQSWTNHMRTKSFLFKALSCYHLAILDRSKRNYGAEISRLTVGMEMCDGAGSHGEKCEIGREEVDSFKRVMEQRRLVAKRENDEIFKEPVLNSRQIEAISGHRMAKPLPLDASLITPNKLLFSSLLPRSI